MNKKIIEESINFWKSVLDEYSENEILLERKMSTSQLRKFYSKLSEGEVEFQYQKKDNSIRKARGTLKLELIPKNRRSRIQYNDYDELCNKAKRNRNFVVYYFDLDRNDIRRFHITRFRGYIQPQILKEAQIVGGERKLGRHGLITYPKALLTEPGEAPKTFNEELLSSIKSPSGSPVSYKFYTDGKPNSEYIICKSGESRRIKGDQGKRDSGLHNWNDLCLFSPNYELLRDEIINCFKQTIPVLLVEIGKKGKYTEYTIIKFVNGKYLTAENKPSNQKTLEESEVKLLGTTIPEIGLDTFEIKFRKEGNLRRIISIHPGHSVCYIEK